MVSTLADVGYIPVTKGEMGGERMELRFSGSPIRDTAGVQTLWDWPRVEIRGSVVTCSTARTLGPLFDARFRTAPVCLAPQGAFCRS